MIDAGEWFAMLFMGAICVLVLWFTWHDSPPLQREIHCPPPGEIYVNPYNHMVVCHEDAHSRS